MRPRRSRLVGLFTVGALAAAVVTAGAQQQPILARPRPALAAPQGPITITMPDGSRLPGAANQLMVFLSRNVTAAQRQAVASVIAAGGGQVAGELPVIKMLQVQIANPATTAALLVRLQVQPGVRFAGPSLFLRSRAPTIPCRTATVGPIPGQGPTGWVQADRLAISTGSGDDVLFVVADQFAVPGQAPPPGLEQHGDVVAAYAMDAAGRNASGTPILQLGRNVFEMTSEGNDVLFIEQLDRVILTNPGKKIVVNFSGGPLACDAGSSPDLLSVDPVRRAQARAGCANADSLFYENINEGFLKGANDEYGDRIILVNAAGNVDVAVAPATSLSSCHFIPVGGLDQTSPNRTIAPFSEIGAAIPVYAPACNISPLSMALPATSPFRSGNSFAAPQVAGQIAAIWSGNPRLTACQMGGQIFSLPNVPAYDTGAVFNGQTLATLAIANQPGNDALPSPVENLACNAITVSPSDSIAQVGSTVQLNATRVAQSRPTFLFQSSNPDVVTVDGNGVVTVKSAGLATVSVTHPNTFCAGSANIIVPAETYGGTFSEDFTGVFPNQPGWTPDPYTVTALINGAPMTLSVTRSLEQPGTFAGFLSGGPGTIALTIPTLTCPACTPPNTIPGGTFDQPFPLSSLPVVGVSDGNVIQIPVDGGANLTGILALSGNTQLSMTWTYEDSDPTATFTVRLKGNLTKWR